MNTRRTRDQEIKFRVTSYERALIEEKMRELGTTNREAYLRKMAIDGYVLKLDLPELKELVSLTRRLSNNVNQIAKHANETGRVYGTDISDVLKNQETIWRTLNELIGSLSLMP